MRREAVDVVVIRSRYDGDGGPQAEERAIILVGLHHDVCRSRQPRLWLPAQSARAVRELRHIPPDNGQERGASGRPLPLPPQQEGQESRGGSLAVCASDCQNVHGLCEGRHPTLALQDRDTHPAGLDDLWVVLGHRARGNHNPLGDRRAK